MLKLLSQSHDFMNGYHDVALKITSILLFGYTFLDWVNIVVWVLKKEKTNRYHKTTTKIIKQWVPYNKATKEIRWNF